jgi:Fic family protein
MRWNWQQPDWPAFTFDPAPLAALEARLLHESGRLFGAFAHLDDTEQRRLTIDCVGDEAVMTARIEGEYLDRDSLQSSLLRQFGLAHDERRVPPAEAGMAELMVDLYRRFQAPLSHDTLRAWQAMLVRGRSDLDEVGCYRRRAEPMQVVSGAVYAPRVHFEAPPAALVPAEMERFLAWFEHTAPAGVGALPPLTRAGLAHLYFVSIHPFEDGKGRIARAIAEKALAQGLGQPTLVALSHCIQRHKKAYYEALQRANKGNPVDDWLNYFARTTLDALDYSRARVGLLIAKARLYDRLKGQLNPRQEKVLGRLFAAGPEGFRGGLSAENYIALTRTSRATATRDLQDLVAKGALTRSGERKHTRYALQVPATPGQGSDSMALF